MLLSKLNFQNTWSNSSLDMVTRSTSQKKGTAAKMEMTKQKTSGRNQA